MLMYVNEISAYSFNSIHLFCMNRSTRLIFIVCIAALSGVILLQCLWISNYYQVNRERFDKEVNMAFEDAVKTEFRLRCDTLEELMFRFVMDTSQVVISSKWNIKNQLYVYTIANKKNRKDDHSFSHKLINLPITSPFDSVTRRVARQYVRTFREEDLDRHFFYYHTQNLGKYIGEQAELYAFDTIRLRPIYTRCLQERGIDEPFKFYLRDEDSMVNRSSFPDSLRRFYPVITKSFPTYKVVAGENYVRAMFQTQAAYLTGKMTGIVLASGLLLCIVGFALYFLLRIIGRQKKLSEIKNDFISNISHEFKTPISTIAAAVEAMETFGALEDAAKAKRYLTISKNELDRLAGMVNKILELSLYEKQDPGLKPEPVNIDEMIADLVSSYSMHQGKKIYFHYRNQAGAPTIKADRLHLHNVLDNLIDNAVKYSGTEVKIDIEFSRDQDFYTLVVKDNGIGISGKDLPYIFEKFYRVPSGNIHKIKGYGLGLSYVKYIIEKHGGWCLAESTPGKGSNFKLGLQA